MKRLDRGFTLIEILVAISVFAILSVMAYSGLNSLLSTSEQTRIQAEHLARLQMAMTMLSRDLEFAVPRGVRNEYGDISPAMRANSSLGDNLELTRAGWRNPVGLRRSELQRVHYRLEEEQLIRASWTVLDQAADSEAREVVLMEEVKGFTVRFFDGVRDDIADWPPLNEEGQLDDNAMPIGIEVTLEAEPWGEVQRIFRVPG